MVVVSVMAIQFQRDSIVSAFGPPMRTLPSGESAAQRQTRTKLKAAMEKPRPNVSSSRPFRSVATPKKRCGMSRLVTIRTEKTATGKAKTSGLRPKRARR